METQLNEIIAGLPAAPKLSPESLQTHGSIIKLTLTYDDGDMTKTEHVLKDGNVIGAKKFLESYKQFYQIFHRNLKPWRS